MKHGDPEVDVMELACWELLLLVRHSAKVMHAVTFSHELVGFKWLEYHLIRFKHVFPKLSGFDDVVGHIPYHIDILRVTLVSSIEVRSSLLSVPFPFSVAVIVFREYRLSHLQSANDFFRFYQYLC